MAAKNVAHRFRPVKTRVGPQHLGLGPLFEEFVDRGHIGVGMQDQTLLTRQGDQTSGHRQVSLVAVKVEFAYADVTKLGQPLFQITQHAVVAHPSADLAPRAVGA